MRISHRSLVLCGGIVFSVAPIAAQESAFPSAIEIAQLMEEAGYYFTPRSDTDSVFAVNGGHDLRIEVSPNGVLLQDLSRSWALDLQLSALGTPGNMRDVQPGSVQLLERSAEIVRPGIVEWFVNGLGGVEHGFTIENRPDWASAEAELTLSMEWSGTLSLDPEDQGVASFSDQEGIERLSYGGLRVFDANGDKVPAQLRIKQNTLAIVLDDRIAEYPILIDPVFLGTATELVAPVADPDDLFGYSSDIEGEWLVIGAPRDDAPGRSNDDDTGAVYVFQRSMSGTWNMVQRLDPLGSLEVGDPGAVAGDMFGFSVALSLDNTTGSAHRIAVGSPRHEVELEGGSVPSGVVFACTPNEPGTDPVFPSCTSRDNNPSMPGTNVTVSPASPEDPLDCAPGAVYIFEYDGTTFCQKQRLVAMDDSSGTTIEDASLLDQFGHSVDLTRDTIIVGAPFEEDPCSMIPDCPEADQVCRQCWSGFPVGSANGTENGNFDCPDPPVDWGAAYIYELNTTNNLWEFRTKLREQEGVGPADDRDAFDWFGASVALSTYETSSAVFTVAVVGAPGKPLIDTNGGRLASRAGGAYVYERSSQNNLWSSATPLHNAPGFGSGGLHNAFDAFGQSVSASGFRVAVGAPFGKLGGASATGSAAIFVRGPAGPADWEFESQVFPTNGVDGDRFGASVSLDGTRLLVGAPLYRVGGVSPEFSGGAFLFERGDSGWSQQLELSPSTGEFIESYGFSTAVSGNALLVGAMQHDGAIGEDSGLAYLDADPDLFWDYCYGDSDTATPCGNSCACGLCPCSNASAPQTGGCVNSANDTGIMSATGVPSVGNDTLEITMSGGVPGTIATLIVSRHMFPRSPLNACFAENTGLRFLDGRGLRCLGEPTERAGTRSIAFDGTVGSQTGSNPWGGSFNPVGGLLAVVGFVPGQTAFFQVLYRDVAQGSCGFQMSSINSTQAIGVTVVP